MIESQLINWEPYTRAVTTILIHSLWQGILVGLLTAVALSLLRRRSARIRYAVSGFALVAVTLAAAVTAISVWPEVHNTARSVSAVTSESGSLEAGSDVDPKVDIPVPTNDVSSSNRWWKHPVVCRSIFMIWVVGVILCSAYHFLGWRRARGFVKRGASLAPSEWKARFEKLCVELRIKRIVSLLSSSLVKAPCVVGWLKPVILVPASMFTSLDPSEIEMILVHELAHVRRYDILINMMQTAMETLFFFNPAIWWISRQIRIEREDCCDDVAILRVGSRLRYARALTNLEELRMLRMNSGTAINETPLGHRIQRIFGAIRPPFYSEMQSLTGMLVIASLIVALLGPFSGSNNSALQAGENTQAAQTFKPETGDLRGEWETETDGDQLKILVYGRESSGMSYVLAPGEVANLKGQGKEPFQIVRDAGTLFLEGRLKEQGGKVVGSGRWYFRPDTSYMCFMSRYGLREDDRQKTFSLAIRDISREYLSRMENYGFRNLNVDQLISAGVFEISPELVEEYRELGYPGLTYQQLLSMQVQGVTPDDARQFEGVGVGHLTPEQLISARIQGITPEYVGSFRKAGFRDLTFANFGTLHAFDLVVDDFEDCYRRRFMDLSEENMVWVCGFGITRKDIERMRERGFTDIDSIIKALAEEYGK